MTDKIYIGLNDKKIEAKGAELETILKYRAEAEAEQKRVEAEQQAKEAARQSAIAKLSKLGLTEDEVQAIVGGN